MASEELSIVLEYWAPPSHHDPISVMRRVESLTGTQEDIFIEFYNRNRSLRYCNGCCWKLQDKSLKPAYDAFYKEYNTIEHYYGGGTVD